ncbi:MAG: nucleotide pyrophosphohydrolase [Firmicutes bacterium]|nr:nucleotide pyrophosphohydrolase [Bacillota bacterium]
MEPKIKSTGKTYIEKDRHDIDEFREIVHILCNKDEGCPWDSSQTIESLKPCLINETNEVIEAIDHDDHENLCEELGDVLLQVVIQSEFAERYGWFNFDDVVQGVADKMIRRHPHVFTEEQFDSVDAIRERWYAIKAREKEQKKNSRKNG